MLLYLLLEAFIIALLSRGYRQTNDKFYLIVGIICLAIALFLQYGIGN